MSELWKWFLCSILRCHSLTLCDRNSIRIVDARTEKEAEGLLGYDETYFLYLCVRCGRHWVQKLQGDWVGDDDDDDGEDSPAPTPDDLERMMR